MVLREIKKNLVNSMMFYVKICLSILANRHKEFNKLAGTINTSIVQYVTPEAFSRHL
jgi:hypothetical protein